MTPPLPILYPNFHRPALVRGSRSTTTERRKVKRGTSSCWRCRRHKIRCSFVENDSICLSCRRRGTECVSQGFQADPASTSHSPNIKYHEVGQSLVRVEGLVGQLLGQIANTSFSSSMGKPALTLAPRTPTTCHSSLSNTPPSPPPSQTRQASPDPSVTLGGLDDAVSDLSPGLNRDPGRGDATASQSPEHSVRSIDGEPQTQSLAAPSGQRDTTNMEPASSLPPALSQYYSLSRHLHSLMPSLHSTIAILRKGKFVSLPIQMIQRPYGRFLESSVANQPAEPFDVPKPTSHPVLIARRLIQIALSLQQLHDEQQPRQEGPHLIQSSREASRHYFDAATRYVTSLDLLLASYEGLETLMLEGLYHVNSGNLQLGWLAFRRAIGIAQIMKIPGRSQQEQSGHDQIPSPAQFLWFRLNYSDRFLSLMLGHPFAVADNSFTSPRLMASDVPLGRLERFHTVLMGRIIARNQRIVAVDHPTRALCSELGVTQDLDQEMQRIMGLFPAEWWLPPSLCDLTDGATNSLEETSRLLAQTNHYNLLIILHLPYAIQSLSLSLFTGPHSNYGDSKHTAINASRDVLTRFVLYRKFNEVPSCCRAVDSKALTASIILLLAHLDGHRLGRANLLAHQRPQDLGMVQMAASVTEGLVKSSPDSQGESGLQVLRRLIDVEANAAGGVAYCVHIEGWSSGPECSVLEEGTNLKFLAPYFGKVQIEHQEADRAQNIASAVPASVEHGTDEQWQFGTTPTSGNGSSDSAPALDGAASVDGSMYPWLPSLPGASYNALRDELHNRDVSWQWLREPFQSIPGGLNEEPWLGTI